MFVRWQWWGQRQRKIERWYRWKTPADAHLVLVESHRVDGKPRQRHVAYLGSYHRKERRDHDVNYRAWWWHDMTAKLDRLSNRIPSADRSRIEAAFVQKVHPVTNEEIVNSDLEYTEKFRVERGRDDCRGAYLDWPPGTEGLSPRPKFKKGLFPNVLAAIQGH